MLRESPEDSALILAAAQRMQAKNAELGLRYAPWDEITERERRHWIDLAHVSQNQFLVEILRKACDDNEAYLLRLREKLIDCVKSAHELDVQELAGDLNALVCSIESQTGFVEE